MHLFGNLCTITTGLQTLNLSNNNIDDEGVDVLVGGLTNSNLRNLDLASNHNITSRGRQSVAALLRQPNSNLEVLNVYANNMGDEGALIFANALARNCKLKILKFRISDISPEGWSHFSKVLCDASSTNNTFLSNHTVERLGFLGNNMISDVASLLELNRSSEDKKQVSIRKILKHHKHFDMQPFFEWDLKVLPIAINWFERARSVVNDEAVIDKQKLDTIYQFIRARMMPEVFVPATAGGKRKRSAVVDGHN